MISIYRFVYLLGKHAGKFIFTAVIMVILSITLLPFSVLALQTFAGLQLLEEIKFSDIDNKPHPQLLSATKELDRLSGITLTFWTHKFNERRNIVQPAVCGPSSG